MSALSLIFFAFFAAIIFASYVAVRRRKGSPALIAAGSIVGSILTMFLFSLAQGNILLHAVAVGLVVGGAFSLATLAIAWYFQGNALKADYLNMQPAPSEDPRP